MAGKSYSDATAELKYTYFSNKKLVDTFDRTPGFLNKIKKTTVKDGTQREFAVHTGGNNMTSNISRDTTALPLADKQSNAIFALRTTSFWHPVQVNIFALRKTSDKMAAFVNAFAQETQEAIKDMTFSIGLQSMISNGSAPMATVKTNATTGQADVVLKYAANGATESGHPGAKMLRAGQSIVFVRSGSVVGSKLYTISSIAQSTATLTLTGNITTQVNANDTVHLANNQLYTDNGFTYGMMGYSGIASASNPSGTRFSSFYFQNINRDTAGNEFARGNSIGNSGTAQTVTTALLRRAINYANFTYSFSDMLPDEGRMHKGVWDACYDLVEGARIYNAKPTEAGQAKTFNIDGIPLTWDNQMPYNTIFWPKYSELEIRQEIPIEWCEEGDDGRMQRSATTPNILGALWCDLELICFLPQAQTQSVDLAQTYYHTSA